jgi:DNA-directed RNA polymerase specialized sigma24 family protein
VTRAGSRDRSLSPQSFEGLLARLDPDRERAGERYEALRRKLLRLFTWRGCDAPEDLADEVLDRVARKLGDGADLRTDLGGYVHGIALNVLHEHWRRAEARVPVPPPPPAPPEPAEEVLLQCLDECLEKVPRESRDLVREYHEPEPGARIRARQELARRLGLTPTALRLRAYRVRASLQACLADCQARAEAGRAAGLRPETKPPGTS